jgi:hypothetical protein
MSFPHLKASAGSPLPYTRKQSKLIALAYRALHKQTFPVHLSHFLPLLCILSLTEHMPLFPDAILLFSLPVLSLFTLPAVGFVILPFKAQLKHFFLSKSSSPVD